MLYIKLKKYMKTHSIFFHVFTLILILWTISLLFVLFWGVLVSISQYRGELGYANNKNRIFPLAYRFLNYSEAFSVVKSDTPSGGTVMYGGLLFNSIWYSIGSMLFGIISTTCFAYAIARFNFRGKKAIYAMVLLIMMVPLYGQTAANYELFVKMGLVNSPMFLLSKFAGHGMSFLITHSFFVNVTRAYDESAKIDGANNLTIFLRIHVPIAMPVIITFAILGFIGSWNDYSTMLIYMEKYPTLSSGLYSFANSRDYQGAPVYFAGIFLSALPVIILFMIFNKMLMQNLSLGGIKG